MKRKDSAEKSIEDVITKIKSKNQFRNKTRLLLPLTQAPDFLKNLGEIHKSDEFFDFPLKDYFDLTPL